MNAMSDTAKVSALTAASNPIQQADPAATSATRRGPSGLIALLLVITAVLELFNAAPAKAVPLVGGGGLCPNASALAQHIMANYPGVQSIGGVRADRLPDHPSGHAIDIMIGSNMSLGDAIKADVQANAGKFGVKYILWRVPQHFNHVHVTVF